MTPQRRWATTVGLALTFGLVCSLPASGWAGKRWVNEATGESRSGLYCKIHEEFVPSIAECPGHIAKLANNAGKEMLRPYECPMAHGPGTCHGMNPDYDLSFCLWGKPPAEWDQVAGAEMGPPRAGRDALLSQASQMLGGGASMSLSEQEAWNALNREDGLAPDWDHPSDDCASLRTTLDGRLASDQGLVDEVEKAAPGLDTATSSCSLVAGVLRADRDPCVAFKSPVQHTVTKEFEEEVTVQVTLQRERRSSNFLVGLFGGTETVEHTVNRKQKVTYKKPVREDAPWGKWHAICPELASSTANAGAADELADLLASAPIEGDEEAESSFAGDSPVAGQGSRTLSEYFDALDSAARAAGWSDGDRGDMATAFSAWQEDHNPSGDPTTSDLLRRYDQAVGWGSMLNADARDSVSQRLDALGAAMEHLERTQNPKLAASLCGSCVDLHANDFYREYGSYWRDVNRKVDDWSWGTTETIADELMDPGGVGDRLSKAALDAAESKLVGGFLTWLHPGLGTAHSVVGALKSLDGFVTASMIKSSDKKALGMASALVARDRAQALGVSVEEYQRRILEVQTLSQRSADGLFLLLNGKVDRRPSIGTSPRRPQ